jgi:hypothetical protein
MFKIQNSRRWQIIACAIKALITYNSFWLKKETFLHLFLLDQKFYFQVKRFGNVIIACQKWIELDKIRNLLKTSNAGMSIPSSIQM